MLACLFVMLIGGVVSVMLGSTIKSAISLAVVSVALGVIMFEFGSAWAALFEISVCSGFVTIIFISAISMTSESKDEQDNLYEQKKHMALMPIILILGGITLIAAMVLGHFALPAPPALTGHEDNFREVLWNQHQSMIWGQIIVLITGAFAVVVLFQEDKKL